MTARNPLIGAVPAGRMTAAQLIEYAATLNAKPFVKAMGWEYFVAGVTEERARLERRGG
jgi:hypothetical protein